MRLLCVVLGVGALVGCDAGSMAYDTTLFAQTRGVVLHDDGETGQAGMYGTTCAVYASGGVGEDLDYPSDGEEVQDVGVISGRPVVLITSPVGVHVQTKLGDGAADITDIPMAGVREARFTDAGLVTLRETPTGCQVGWSGDAPSAAAVPTELCAASAFTVDPTSGTAWVAGSSGVVEVTPEGATAVDETGELAAWDAWAEVLYVADEGGLEVRALEPSGEVRWTASVDGAITAIDDLGARAVAVVTARTFNGEGRLFLLDGATGEILDARDLPAAPSEVVTSADGRRVALVRPDAVRFYSF